MNKYLYKMILQIRKEQGKDKAKAIPGTNEVILNKARLQEKMQQKIKNNRTVRQKAKRAGIEFVFIGSKTTDKNNPKSLPLKEMFARVRAEEGRIGGGWENMDQYEEFAKRVATRNVEHPKVLKIWEMLDSIRFNRSLDEDDDAPRNVFLCGLSGVGKTKLVKKYAKKFPGYVDTDEYGTEYDIRPVVYMELPDPFTVQELYQSIIQALGAPRTPGKPSIGEVKSRALHLLKMQRTEMLILDEMDYAQTSRFVTPKEAMQTFKYISNQSDISLVFVGGPETEELIKIGFQYFRRFPKTVLDRFKECDDEWRDFLKNFEQKLQPPFSIGLGDMNMHYPELLYGLSKGLVGILTPTIKEVYRQLGVFSSDFNDFTKARFSVEVLERAYENVIGDILEGKLDKMVEAQKQYEEE